MTIAAIQDSVKWLVLAIMPPYALNETSLSTPSLALIISGFFFGQLVNAFIPTNYRFNSHLPYLSAVSLILFGCTNFIPRT